jgi:hypothetical protein
MVSAFSRQRLKHILNLHGVQITFSISFTTLNVKYLYSDSFIRTNFVVAHMISNIPIYIYIYIYVYIYVCVCVCDLIYYIYISS